MIYLGRRATLARDGAAGALLRGSTINFIEGANVVINVSEGANDSLNVEFTAIQDGVGGDMYKSTYDANNDGIVNNSEQLGGLAGSHYLSRSNHTGTQASSTISDFTEAAQDAIGATLTNTDNISFTYNDVSNQISADLSNIGTAGTFTKVVVDSKGRVSSGGGLLAGDLPAHTHDDRYYTESETDTLLASKAALGHSHALDDLTDVIISAPSSGQFVRHSGSNFVNSAILASDLPGGIDSIKIGNGTISNAEFQYLNGLTGNIQGQIDGKADITHNHQAFDIVDFAETCWETIGNSLADSSSINFSYAFDGSTGTISGTVNDNSSIQKITVSKNGTAIGTRKNLNLIEGSNVTLTVSDDSVNDRVNVTINSSAGGGGGGDMYKSTYDANNDSIIDNSAALGGQNSAYHLDRSNHTGTQASSTISDFTEATQDVIGATLTNTATLNLSYNDGAGQISGTVNDNSSIQKITVRRNSSSDTGSRKRLNFIEGSNITLTVADDSVGDEIDITIAATGISLSQVYPVGCIYTEVTGVNPSTTFGFGTWVAFGAGRCLVGVDTGQTEFNTIEKTGGAKTHTLTINEIPAHTHTQVAANGGGSVGNGGVTANAQITNTGSAGGSQDHNNLQPYITVYFWKRTA